MLATRRRPIEPELGGGAFGFRGSMNWSDERYVRVYTRDTADWLSLSFIAQGLFCLLLRKVDRAGVLQLGRHGKRAVAIAVGHAGDWPRLEPALEELLADGCVSISGDYLTIPNFLEAQEAPMSDAQRQRESREKRKAMASSHGVTGVTGRDIRSRNVTDGHDSGQNVTSGHTPSHPVTPSLPSLTDPTTYTQAAGALDREAIEAKHDSPPHPLMDAVVMALRSRGLKPQYPRNGMRASVEAAIEAVGVELATDRIVGGWVVSKPWLSYYLDKIAPPPPEVRRRPVVLPPADGWEPAPGPPPDESTPLFPDDP